MRHRGQDLEVVDLRASARRQDTLALDILYTGGLQLLRDDELACATHAEDVACRGACREDPGRPLVRLEAQELQEHVEGAVLDERRDALARQMHTDILVCKRNETFGEARCGRDAAGHEAVVAWREARAVAAGEDIAQEVLARSL